MVLVGDEREGAGSGSYMQVEGLSRCKLIS